jgi:hypothetical protein
METSLAKLIYSGRWERALFTSYVFSSSFFETEILRGLRQSGCQQIQVLVDTKGYRDSLVERRTSSIGQDIRLIPVHLPNGVFHPKITYLVSEQAHVLAIGSGNLTFGGFGRNLEVLEILSSKESPEAFYEFAGFLDAFEKRLRKDVQCPDTSWIYDFKKYALQVGKPNSTDDSRPTILHSVDEPIVDQLERLFGTLSPRTLTIMSPYFDPNAGAVRRLVQALGCENLQIAVSPKSKKTNFPAMEAKKWTGRVNAVWSTDADEKRAFVHAKWIEIHDGEMSAVLTGSINATGKALCSTDNIEVGILRVQLKGIGWTKWTKADFPNAFEPCNFDANKSGELVAFATAHSDGSVSGRIIGLGEPQGKYDATLSRPTGESVSFPVALQTDGSFSEHPRVTSAFLLAAGLQIILRREEVVARGWVHVEDVLSLPRLPKLNIPSFLRMLRREHTEDDEIALLEYFAVDATRHSSLFSEPIGKTKDTTIVPRVDDLDSLIDLNEIKPDPIAEIGAPRGTKELELASGSLKRMFSRLRLFFLALDIREGTAQPSIPRMSVEVEGTDEEDPSPEEAHLQSAIDVFDERMRELIEAEKLGSNARRGLCVLWFEVFEYMKTVRSEDFEDAFAFMREWSGFVGTGTRANDQIDALEQHLVSCLSTMSLVLTDSAPELNSDFHDTLEHFYSGAVSPERAHEALLVNSVVPYSLVLKQQNATRMKAGLDRILSAPTVRQQLEQFIENFHRSGAIDDDSPLFHGSAGRKILDYLHTAHSGVHFATLLDERPICPHCYFSLPSSMEQQLSRSRIAYCECGRLIVRRKP